MPSLADLVKYPNDLQIIHSMFDLRLQLWDGETLSQQNQQVWDTVRNQVPQWALFHRLNLNDEQKQARKEAEEQVQKEFDSLSDDPNTL
jgi:hypothetical protein